MDIPYAIQTYLLQYQPLVTALAAGNNGVTPPGGGVYLLELPTSLTAENTNNVPPFQCTVVRAGGGAAKMGRNLQLKDPDIIMQSYGQTPHLAYNLDSIIYQALKYMSSHVWANTYIHWCIPKTHPIPLRDPDLQWPYVSSVWATLASDMTVSS